MLMSMLDIIKNTIKTQKYQDTLAQQLSHKKQLRVAFFVVSHTAWKLHTLYQAMLVDKRFVPYVVICPIVNYGHENMERRMELAYNYFISHNYENVKKAYDKTTNSYLDVKKELAPDIIFYTNPYKGLVDDRYYIDQYPDILSCYVPYGYNNINTKDNYTLPFHQLLWKFYLENGSITSYYHRNCIWIRHNHVNVGYPPFDEYKRIPKQKEKKYKYIIWAPHHTIEPVWNGKLYRDWFLRLHQVMLDLCDKYKESVFIIFRPHPLLKNKLYLHKDWGTEKTDAYYAQWNSMPNALLSETRDYIDDFSLSDAMIHDCGSFTVEYLYTEKPVMFTGIRPNKSTLTPSAHEAFDCYQFGQNKDDIEKFILNLLEGGDDALLAKKKHFKSKYLTPPNRKSASQNIIDDIVNSIWKK